MQLPGVTELELFHLQAHLEYREEHLDLPACAVPVDQLTRLLQRGGFPVGQQPPDHGLAACGGVDFRGNQTGDFDLPLVQVFLAFLTLLCPLAIAQADTLHANLLPDHPGLAPTPWGQLEDQPADALALHHPIPELAPQPVHFGQYTVVLAAHQVVGRMVEFFGPDHQGQHVGLAVAHEDVPGIGQFAGLLGNDFVALYPAATLHRPAPGFICVLELPRPHPGVDDSQRLAFWRDDIRRVQVHAALRFVAQRPQPLHLLSVVVQLCGVL